MKREKTERVIVIFKTTTAALQMEKAAKTAGMEGRLIPLPREISAGCGLAWSAPAETEGVLRDLIKRCSITPDGIQKMILFM